MKKAPDTASHSIKSDGRVSDGAAVSEVRQKLTNILAVIRELDAARSELLSTTLKAAETEWFKEFAIKYPSYEGELARINESLSPIVFDAYDESVTLDTDSRLHTSDRTFLKEAGALRKTGAKRYSMPVERMYAITPWDGVESVHEARSFLANTHAVKNIETYVVTLLKKEDDALISTIANKQFRTEKSLIKSLVADYNEWLRQTPESDSKTRAVTLLNEFQTGITKLATEIDLANGLASSMHSGPTP